LETTSIRDFPFGGHWAELATIHSTFERSANRLDDQNALTFYRNNAGLGF